MKKADKSTIEREKVLVSRCVVGEKRAWDEFVDAYKALIYHAIIKAFQLVGYSNTEEVAGDIFQDVFASLLNGDYAKLRGFKWKNDCSLASWLHIVTKNATFDFLRKHFRRGDIMESLSADDENEPADYRIEGSEEILVLQNLENEERNEIFDKALKELPKEDLLLIDLIYFRGVSHKNAAKILGKSIDALYMHKKRVIEKIKKTIEVDHGKYSHFNKRSV
ncbi:MAG: sigma-70 family RNA polymerase sigma factor [Candidatus Omnitrophica bacterium]|nr:sigma-70 family RNA polymerase sigma factor [Candidatus Omnitrophota bacterium]MBU4488183.1 sigma-70 family RNA polymerase sigma factor [Candidatus Omnitrophota bacterium]MCG2704783.1 sigma-70 family RNA polymerase sigma factor [Candidatus Omnitrophota bacterium]